MQQMVNNGAAVELGAGHNGARDRPDGHYILGNGPPFNPSAALREDWTKLEKGR